MKSVSRRQALLLAFLVVLVAVWAFWPKNDGRARSSVPEGLQQGARGAVRVASELPSLEDLKAERGELAGAVHRNVFRFYDAPTPVPPTPRPTATPVPVQGSRSFIGPLQLTPTPTATPIVPPPVPYKAVGVFGPRDQMIAALEEGSRLIGAREGDVLDGKFILKKINLESIDFAFVGLPPEITRRIPIAGAAPGR
jgi:hypothetical protein